MNEIIYMKAGYEPWWMFPGWEKTIIEKHVFSSDMEALAHLELLLTKFRKAFPNEENQKGTCWAFWSEEEQEFCEACDDDLQTYHGIMWLKNGKPTQL
ncbi:DUF1033 family protein [Paenisporosarcina sp. TG20]|uniref:DUF1033 family protein n=1 Tax=Paenisporosarcina sp. TG20 TaxID=1211706 RepID=UPI00031B2D56|nr:DUF1033 family protein [Paenisporosarcina sp. TG20]